MFDPLFATETMAELSARQGRLADAVSIYRHLVGASETAPAESPDGGARLEKWKARLAEATREPAGLLNDVNRSVKVVAVAVAAAKVAAG